MLWFAWKIVLLQYRKQLSQGDWCDVLVVICLKNRTFAVSQTTVFILPFAILGCDLLEKSYFCSIANNKLYIPEHLKSLWFAWKIVLLQYRKQPSVLKSLALIGCDLLEKSYFCSIANNCMQQQNTRQRLWFAWKIVLLQYRKQLLLIC